MTNSSLASSVPAPRANPRARGVVEGFIHALLWVCAGVSVVTTVGIVVVLMVESLQFFSEVSIVEFLTDTK